MFMRLRLIREERRTLSFPLCASWWANALIIAQECGVLFSEDNEPRWSHTYVVVVGEVVSPIPTVFPPPPLTEHSPAAAHT